MMNRAISLARIIFFVAISKVQISANLPFIISTINKFNTCDSTDCHSETKSDPQFNC